MKKFFKFLVIVIIISFTVNIFISCQAFGAITELPYDDSQNTDDGNDINDTNDTNDTNNTEDELEPIGENEAADDNYISDISTEDGSRVKKGSVEIAIQGSDEVIVGYGSGFLAGKHPQNGNPIIVTNYHVVEKAITEIGYSIKVKLGDKADYFPSIVSVMGYDEDMDIAILELEKQISDIDDRILNWGNSRELMIFQEVWAIGNSLGYGTRGSEGVISDSEVVLENETCQKHLILHTSAINPGNSGGILVNADAEVVGINSYIYLNDVTTATGFIQIPAEGMGLAIPSNLARGIYDYVLLLNSDETPEINASVARTSFPYNFDTIGGRLDNQEENNILQVIANIDSVLRNGDIITAVNGINIDNWYSDKTENPTASIFQELSYYYDTENNTALESNEFYQLKITVKRSGIEQIIDTGYFLQQPIPWLSELKPIVLPA